MSDRTSSKQTNESRISRIRKKTRQSQSNNFPGSAGTTDHERVNQVRKEWEHRNFYIPSELDDALDDIRSEMADDIEAEYGGSMAVTRHFYPVMIQLGLEQIKEMTATDFAARVDTIPGVHSKEFKR